MLVGETAAIGGFTPVPEMETKTGLFAASLLIVSVADPAPAECGKNTTWVEQLPPGATKEPATQFPDRMKKSGSPLTSTLLMCSIVPPVLVTVTVWVGLSVLTTTLPKLRLVGETAATGGFAPVPEMGTETGLFAASLPIVSVAEPAPAECGKNTTWVEQLPPGATPEPPTQLLVRVKK